jgi:hypothetical protein
VVIGCVLVTVDEGSVDVAVEGSVRTLVVVEDEVEEDELLEVMGARTSAAN